MLGKFLLLSTVVLGLNLSSASAAPEDVPEHDLSFELKDGYILAEGGFAEDTAQKFKAFLAENGKAEGRWNIPLYVQLRGGSLGAAMEMGQMLREHGMSTVSLRHAHI